MLSKPVKFILVFTVCKVNALRITCNVYRAHTHLCILLLYPYLLVSHIHASHRGDMYIASVMNAIYETHTDRYYIYAFPSLFIDMWRSCQMAVALRSIQPQGRCLLDETWQKNFYFLLKTFFLSHIIPILLNQRTFGKVFFRGWGVWFFFVSWCGNNPWFHLVFVFF